MLINTIKLVGAFVLVIYASVTTLVEYFHWPEKYPKIKKVVEAKALRVGLLVVAIILLFAVFQEINAVREALNVPPPSLKAPPAPVFVVQESSPPATKQITSKPATTKPPVQINNAPNGIAIGGGNVTSPTVNNFGPRPLMLFANQQDYLATNLSGFAGQNVEIDVDGATPMTNDFAGALQSSLRKAGIVVSRTDAIFSGGCLKYPGVSFMAGVNRTVMVNAIWSALLGAKVVEGKVQGCSRSGEPDELHIYVRPPA